MNFRFETTSAVELPAVINTLGPQLKGLELGVWYGFNMGYLLDNCPNIRELHGIDPYKEYKDWNRYIDQAAMDAAYDSAVSILNNFQDRKWCLWRSTSEQVAAIARIHQLNDLDFIFIDGDHSFDNCYKDLNLWYENVKPGGLFSGHDFTLPGVNEALLKFRKERNIKGFFKVIPNDVWYWIKE